MWWALYGIVSVSKYLFHVFVVAGLLMLLFLSFSHYITFQCVINIWNRHCTIYLIRNDFELYPNLIVDTVCSE